jgi:glycosyltransferase involved in cell wall biosynthesis
VKIIHVTDELQPEAGGLVSVPINLAAAQAALGHDVILFGRTGGDRLEASCETNSIPNFNQVTLIDCKQAGLAAKLVPLKTIAALKKFIKPGSIVHLHGVWDPVLFLASRIARKAGASYVVTPHSMLHPWQMKRYVWQKKLVFAVGWRRMFRQAAFIHTLNPDEQKYVEAYGFGAPTEIMPNGIYPDAMKAVEPNPFLDKHPELKDRRYILFLSRLHYQKGIVNLLDGFGEFAKSNPDIQLVLAGPDCGELAVINEKLSTMDSAKRVFLPGPLYGNEKIGALHGASCFALTSLNEGFSVAILEALACRLPVVISENCFFPDVAEFNAGLIPSLEACDIATAFSLLFKDEVKRAEMADNAKRMVEERYGWPRIGRLSVELYGKYQS